MKCCGNNLAPNDSYRYGATLQNRLGLRLMDEQYIKIVPLKNVDNKRISQNKKNPLQRIKVTNGTHLRSIANYIQQLGNCNSDNFQVALYAQHGNSHIQLPLSMSIFEFFMITELEEVRYTFVETTKQKEKKAQPVYSTPQPNEIRLNAQRVPPAIINLKPPTFQNILPPPIVQVPTNQQNSNLFSNLNVSNTFQPPHPTDSQVGPLFHSGFSLFSNSFGYFLPNMDSQYLQPNEQESKQSTSESVSLRKDLEQFLRK